MERIELKKTHAWENLSKKQRRAHAIEESELKSSSL